jgi:hypothetical protein
VGCGWKHGLAGIGAKTSHWASQYSPTQVGFASLPAGHWVYLQITRSSEMGALRSIPLRFDAPQDLTVDVEGFNRNGSSIQCELVNSSRQAIAGFEFDHCDPIRDDGRQPVTWRGRKLSSLGSVCIQIGVRLTGHGMRLFGLDLQRASQ